MQAVRGVNFFGNLNLSVLKKGGLCRLTKCVHTSHQNRKIKSVSAGLYNPRVDCDEERGSQTNALVMTSQT